MSQFIHQFYGYYRLASQGLDKLHSIAVLVIRLYIAKVFFWAGLTKIQDWDTTLFLFEEEYQVPFIPFEAAAYLGTFGELVFPVLLAVGLMSRFAALSLFVVNVVAVISLADIAPAAMYLHVLWGVLLAQVVVYGGGLLSLDKLLKVKWLQRSIR
ncbi:DoxX family protein [Maricurvus nonylphenolicus]|uniref:DoxX family protein n=1 Tax=Maricurvus nonylphenolicus TaxID=1008307 RepID=UPI0036F32C9D